MKKRDLIASPGHQKLVTAAVFLIAGVAATALANPSGWLQTGFDAAINNSSINNTALAAAERTWTPPRAKSEAEWLDGNGRDQDVRHYVKPVNLVTPNVAKGDTFVLTSGGKSQKFEVVAIEPLALDEEQTVAGTTPNKVQPVLVICRSTNTGRPKTLKFLLDGTETELPWAPASRRTRAHAL